jgi:hypothetical protein
MPKPILPPDKDAFTKYAAGVLAAHIQKFWHDRGGAGHLVRAERYEIPEAPGLWGVRSNLVNGLPPRMKWS